MTVTKLVVVWQAPASCCCKCLIHSCIYFQLSQVWFKLYPIKLSRKQRELPYPFCPHCFIIFPIISIQQQRGPFDNVSANVMSHCHSESILLTLGVVQPMDFKRCVLTIIEDSLKFIFYLLWSKSHIKQKPYFRFYSLDNSVL